MEQARSITFVIPGASGSPGVQIKAVEALGGKLDMTVNVLQSSTLTADLRGLFFNVADDLKLAGLGFTQSQNTITDFDTVEVIQLKNGANMNGAANPFDVGFEFGTAGRAKDDIKSASFTLDNAAHNLNLDDIAHMNFGVRLTSIGSPADNKRGEKDGAKLVAVSPAAPHAFDDAYDLFEDGASGLGDARSTSTAVKLLVLANDTDADAGQTLRVVEVENGAHGTVQIVDGPDADNLPGDAIAYTPDTDYSGTDAFDYRISDGQGGFDTAHVGITVQAVADVPAVTVQVVDAADQVNEVRLLVTATQTDDDGSEFLTSLVAGAVPAGVSITPASAPVVGTPGQLQQEFMVTLPMGQNVDYTQLFTSGSKEAANDDAETGSAGIAIGQVHLLHEMSAELSVDDASLWANGSDPGASIEGPFLGFEVGPDIDLYPYPLYYHAQAQIKTGLQTSIAIAGGTVDAELTYDVSVESTMNVTTDTLLINTSATLADGNFVTHGPGGGINLDWIFGYDLAFQVGLDFDADLGDTLEVEFLNLSESGNWASTNLWSMGPGDAPIELGLEFGTSSSLQWADVSMSGSFDAATQSVKGEGSANFIDFQTDIDALLSSGLLGLVGASPLDIPLLVDGIDLDVEATPDIAGVISLLDIDLNAALGLKQQLELSAKSLTGQIVFENGHVLPITFGSELLIQNAAASYDAVAMGGNGNGVVEYRILLDGQATLGNRTDMTTTRGYSLDVLKYDLDFDLEYGIGSYNGAVDFTLFHEDGQSVTTTGLADQTFDIVFGTWESALIGAGG